MQTIKINITGLVAQRFKNLTSYKVYTDNTSENYGNQIINNYSKM